MSATLVSEMLRPDILVCMYRTSESELIRLHINAAVQDRLEGLVSFWYQPQRLRSSMVPLTVSHKDDQTTLVRDHSTK